MIRSLKILGLALTVVLALSAIAAAAASAWPARLVSDGPVTLVGTQTGLSSSNRLSAFGMSTQCLGATYTGHKWASTPHQLIPSSSDLITITPHYGSCTTAGFPSTIDMNGCDFELWMSDTVSTDQYGSSTELRCPAEKHVTVTIFSSSTKHFEGKPFCHITITETAGGYIGIRVTDTTNGLVDISGEMTNISAHKSSPTGSILCPTESTSQASISQDLTVQGRNAAGESTPIAIYEG